MKSEPDVYSIDDLMRDGRTAWSGVRNYQARNFMRDDMRVGDAVLFYHSNAEPPGIAGIARVCSTAHPDATAWDPRSEYSDPKSKPGSTPWQCVDVAFVERFVRFVTLDDLRATPALADMMDLRKGCRLSVQPVDGAHIEAILNMGRGMR